MVGFRLVPNELNLIVTKRTFVLPNVKEIGFKFCFKQYLGFIVSKLPETYLRVRIDGYFPTTSLGATTKVV